MPADARPPRGPERIRVTIRAILSLVAIAALTGTGGTPAAALEARSPSPLASDARIIIKAETFAELQAYLLGREPDVDLFRARGPFGMTVHEDREVRLANGQRIRIDVFRSDARQKAPLVILLHGHDASKRAHAKQAAHIASWGMHAVTVQLPNQGPWDANGATLAKLVDLVHRSPQAIDSGIDPSRIIVAGHSFGAFAVAVALAAGAPAAGAILLDPAAPGQNLPNLLRRIRKPVMVIGADNEDSPPRNHDYFYEFIRSRVAEVSIRDAVHEDAQYPSEVALQNGGVDPHTTEELQVTFVSALTAAAIGLAATGALDYPWASIHRASQSSKFFNAKKK